MVERHTASSQAAKGGMVKCGKSEGGLGHGRQVLQLAAFGDAALRQADLALAALQGRPHGEVRQEGTKVGVAN